MLDIQLKNMLIYVSIVLHQAKNKLICVKHAQILIYVT